MSGKMQVAGCRGAIRDPDEFLAALAKCGPIEAYDAGAVLGREHVEVAWEHARRAIADGRGQCDSLPMEARLFVACERQIKNALRKTGIKKGHARIALASEDAKALEKALKASGLKRDDSVLEATEEKMLAFGIGRREVDAIGERARDVVFEMMALMEVERG